MKRKLTHEEIKEYDKRLTYMEEARLKISEAVHVKDIDEKFHKLLLESAEALSKSIRILENKLYKLR